MSPATRFVAFEENVTERPSALIAGPEESPLAWVPSDATYTRVVTPVERSCTNPSVAPVSPATRFDAYEAKVT